MMEGMERKPAEGAMSGGAGKPWLKFYDEGVPHSIDYPAVPLHELLTQSAAKHPDLVAIRYGARVGNRLLDGAMTYRELDEAVDRFAAAVQGLGVEKGDRVAIQLPNCPQFVIAFYGTLRAGGIAVPCNPMYTAGELAHQVKDAGAEILMTLTALYGRAQEARREAGLRHVVVTNVKEYFPPVLRLLFTVAREKKEGHRAEVTAADDLWFQELLEAGAGRTLRRVETGPQDTACLLYTGGTTGVPKGAQLLHRNLVSNALVGLAWSHSREGKEVSVGALPFFHSYGLTAVMNLTVAGAGTMVLIPNPRDVLHVMGSIGKHQATLYPGVPTMYVAINNHPKTPEFDLSSTRVCLSGAAPLPREVQERFEAITGSALVEAYGLTETSPATHVNPVMRNKVGTIGTPVPDTDARVVDADTGEREMAVGEIGELIIRGPQVMKGYWNQPTETANVLREHPGLGPGLWLHTGDIARMDSEGYFEIVDRKKDMIICGGFNVYPRDVEEVLFQHPAVREAAVAGVPDEYRGETVRAFVALHEGMKASEEEIIAFCRERLAKYKVPTAVEFRTELPKSMVGKVLRRELTTGR